MKKQGKMHNAQIEARLNDIEEGMKEAMDMCVSVCVTMYVRGRRYMLNLQIEWIYTIVLVTPIYRFVRIKE